MGKWKKIGHVILLLLITACGGSGGGDKSNSLSGIASKAPISEGSATAFALKADGTIGSQLGTATTKLDGSFSINIGTFSGNILVEVTGGVYTDEATGNMVNNTAILRVAITGVSGNITASVTPLTEIAVRLAGTLTQANIDQANSLVSNMIGGIDITTTSPTDVTNASSASAGANEKDYGLFLAAISQMISDGTATDVEDAIAQITNDLLDDQLDSTGANISSALSNFITSTNNQTGLGLDGTNLDDIINSGNTSSISANANLSGLSISSGTLSPAFDRNITNYTASVGFSIATITVTPTVEAPGASLTVNSVATTGGLLVSLNVGDNPISVVVTAVDGTTKTYTTTVTRLATASANLSGLSISSGTLSPTFDKNITSYTANAAFPIVSITITPTVEDAAASVTVDGISTTSGLLVSLNEGANPINIVVAAVDGTTKTYTIIVTRQGAAIFAQQAYIKASNTGLGHHFGEVMAFSGDTLAVASPNAPAVYIFTRSGGNWSQQAIIEPSDVLEDGFRSLALSGNTLAIGIPNEDSNATGINGDQTNNLFLNSGAVYIFTRSGGNWSQQAYIKASNTQRHDVFLNNDMFGSSVVLFGDTLAVGAPREDSISTGVNGDQTNNLAIDSGAVYVFTRSGDVWSQQAYIKASNTKAGDQFSGDLFGGRVALSGDTLAVGAIREDSNATGVNGDQTNNRAFRSGAVYVFTRSGGIWSQQAYIKASNTDSLDNFGGSLTLFGDTLAVGASVEDSNATGVNGDQTNNSALGSGAVYVFTRSGVNWSQQTYLKASNTEFGDLFGTSLALSGGTFAVGALFEDSNATGVNGDQTNNSLSSSGAVYVFQ